jgi:purine-nucleoside phosphorylase
MDKQKKIKKTINFLHRRVSFSPEILIILGSGLGGATEGINVKTVLPYAEIPYFKKTTVLTHKGSLIFGNFAGKKIIVMQGRFHLYEGHSVDEVVYPIMVAATLGVKILITTNLSGGINKEFKVGDFMVVRDHINLSGVNPLVGFKNNRGQVDFLDMFNAYSPRLAGLLRSTALKLKIKLREGILAFLTGPNFETTAELRFLRTIGADAVGWSLVPEVIMARRMGMEVLAISCISDLAYPDNSGAIDLSHVFHTGIKQAGLLRQLLFKFVPAL